MPTYTYKCTNENCEKSGETFDVVQRISEDKLKICSICGSESLIKVISSGGAGFSLQGGGWTRKIGSLHANKN